MGKKHNKQHKQQVQALTSVDITQEDLDLMLALLEMVQDTGVVDEKGDEIWSADEVLDLWGKLVSVEDRADSLLRKETQGAMP